MYFKIGSIPVRILPVFWIVAFLIGWLNTYSTIGTVIWGVVILTSVLIHELGHATCALYFGQRARIELFGLGGVTRHNGRKLLKWQEFLIVLSGPVFGMLLAVVSFYLLKFVKEESLLYSALTISFIMNIFWTVVNLLPVQPLDGGHLFRIFLEGIFGFKGMKISLVFSMILGGILSLYCFVKMLFLPGALFSILAFENFRAFKGLLGSTDQDQDEALQMKFSEAQNAFNQDDDEKAATLLKELRDQTQKGILYNSATELLATLYQKQGNTALSSEMFSQANTLSLTGLLIYSHVAFELGMTEKAIELATKCYQLQPSVETALFLSLAHAKKGEAVASSGWLNRACSDGEVDLDQVLSHLEYDRVKYDASFKKYLK